ncbi:MAG: GNAT family N-acetyltransferase [Candidatus Accumulibacter sp.]|uniref:GNAT family N-acetyltransferase n=1 Tax=Accumulibacter sp. TaxID=2053492 RepID=UPI001B10CF33|nr:GNAT family N-acetyltransferase [Accumulibacter sp.]MBO3701655.1 GNAT family N-acetyltransferase [Accumulibacter sp.]
MHERDVYRQVAQLHASNIDQGFLSSLGTPFLALLYEAIDANESSVLLIARHEGRVVGFVTGAEGMGPIYRQLLRRWASLAGALLPAVVSPHKLWKIAEILLMGKKPQPLSDLPHAELLSIAVDPALRSQGHAGALYRGLVEHFRQRGVDRFRIVVGEPLAAAHHFYSRMGAEPVGRIEVHQGETSVLYVHRLARSGTPAHGIESHQSL